MGWLITGGFGQLGIAISKELSERGLQYNAFNSRDLDITESQQVSELIALHRPDVIVNCAAWTNVDAAEKYHKRAFRINSEGAYNIAIAAKKNESKLIQVSTDYVFAGDAHELLEVDLPTNPESVYGRTKAEGEKLVLKTYPERSYIVRTAWLYSPWGTNFAKTITKLALSGEMEIRVVDDQIGQPTSAIDLAGQIIDLALSGSPTGIYHGTNSGEASRFQFAREIFTLMGANANSVVAVPTSEYEQVAKRPSRSVLGQKSWEMSELQPMRNWKEALESAMPAIISSARVDV